MVELRNIQFGYAKGRKLFDGVSLTLTPGHVYGLLGKNGAGKTTLLKIMSGLRFASGGDAIILGHRAEARDAETFENCYFLQEEMFVPHLKIKEFVKAYAPFYPNFDQEQFDHFMTEFELTGERGYIDRLSHGQKKKVLISFALATNTQILLMDEPTNGLDIPSKSVFRRVVASTANENRIIVISTHQVRDLHSLIDTVTILDNGKIMLNATTEEITNNLVFDFVAPGEHTPADSEILYSEDTPRGIFVVRENTENTDSKLDIEMLFNAVIAKPEKIQKIFEL